MKFLTSTLLVLMLAGCATPYKSNGLAGGYSDLQIAENMFKVSFRGNGFTNLQRARDFALLRGAELALGNNYKYFVIIEEANEVENQAHRAPVEAHTRGHVYDSGSFNATTRFTGGQTYNIATPSSTNTILCFKEKPENHPHAYNAESVYKNMTAKYDIVKWDDIKANF